LIALAFPQIKDGTHDHFAEHLRDFSPSRHRCHVCTNHVRTPSVPNYGSFDFFFLKFDHYVIKKMCKIS
jgi:hypothetical protein